MPGQIETRSIKSGLPYVRISRKSLPKIFGPFSAKNSQNNYAALVVVGLSFSAKNSQNNYTALVVGLSGSSSFLLSLLDDCSLISSCFFFFVFRFLALVFFEFLIICIINFHFIGFLHCSTGPCCWK